MSLLASTAPLTIIADDLTGALDTAGPFASAGAPIPVVRGIPGSDGGLAARIAISTESRDLEFAAATAAARTAARVRLEQVGRQGLWFKKVDSVLRGHPLDEIIAIAEAAEIERIVLAPAFPEQGRRTVCGRQEARTPEGWAQVGEDMVAGFRTRDVPAMQWSLSEGWPSARVVVLDANDPADLDRVAAHLMPLLEAQPMLVVGCGGLAEAMAGRPPPRAFAQPDLIVVGSPHPVMQEQVRAARGAVPLVAFAAGVEAAAPPPPGGLPVLVVPEVEIATQAAAEQALAAAIERMVARGDHPKRLFVSGGATLSLVAAATGSREIECIGHAAPGLPCSRLIEGAWHGCEVMSKSGGFGRIDLLTELLQTP